MLVGESADGTDGDTVVRPRNPPRRQMKGEAGGSVVAELIALDLPVELD